MSDVAASGGYYIAAAADEIIASPNTITGSIGVFAGIPTFSRTLAKLGVNVDGVGTTPLSGATRARPPDVGRCGPSAAGDGRSCLRGIPRARREGPRQHARSDRRDRAGSGVGGQRCQRSIGLVDRLGTYDDAVAEAAARGGLKAGYGVRRIEPELSWAQQLLFQVRSTGERMLERVGVARSGIGAAGTASEAARPGAGALGAAVVPEFALRLLLLYGGLAPHDRVAVLPGAALR